MCTLPNGKGVIVCGGRIETNEVNYGGAFYELRDEWLQFKMDVDERKTEVPKSTRSCGVFI